MTSVEPLQKKSIRFRARSFVAFALAPEAPVGEWFENLDRWTGNSPGFFAGRPVVLDLTLLKPTAEEAKSLVAQLAERGIRTYAIEAEGLADAAADLPPLLVGAKPVEEKPPLPGVEAKPETIAPAEPVAEPAEAVGPEAPASANSLMIQAPIRSGQSIFHPHGDVIVLGSVASGSEIVAGGSVHIYGALRGRVFAGATGNPEARIFCRKNEAELLAVDGWYRTADDMEPSSRGRPIQAFLEDGVIHVKTLN